MRENIITQYFEEIETTKEYNGYFCSVAEAITIVILGSICGLKNISQIHQWADNNRVKEFLKEKFEISTVPCYYWLLCLIKLVKPESLNRCFIKWAEDMMPEKKGGFTIAMDGMVCGDNALVAGCPFWRRRLPCGGQKHPAKPEYAQKTGN